MGNLGWYQVMTILAKKVGGPLKLAGIICGGGAVVGGSVVMGCLAIKNKVSKELEKKKKEADSAMVYEVMNNGKSNEGLEFVKGDKVKVLEVDGDAALIEKIGNENNPYFVAASFLESISDYRIKK